MNARDPVPIKKPLVWAIRIVFWGCLLVVLYFAFTAVTGVINRPHKPDATLAICTELEQAIQRFHDDNGTLPADVQSDESFSSNSPKGVEMLRVLFDQETGGPDAPILNAKGIKYANFKQARGNKEGEYRNGIAYNEDGSEVIGLFDSWGGPIMIALDGDFDGSITVQPKAQKEPRTLQRMVAVWSNGKDPDKAKDDVITW